MNHEQGLKTALEQLSASLVSVPGGEITLRDDRIKRQWTVALKPFQLAQVPVTQEQYFAVMQQAPFTFEGAQKPAESVSWNDAVAFCNRLSKRAGLRECYALDQDRVTCDWGAEGYRLPTEAEWEYACRAGSTQPRYGELNAIAWYLENSRKQTQDVGKKAPNAWGLYDMLGNVWEWCWDLYDPEVYGPYRVFRGGGWCDPERGCLASNRRRSHPTFKIDDLGFRVARSS